VPSGSAREACFVGINIPLVTELFRYEGIFFFWRGMCRFFGVFFGEAYIFVFAE